MQFLSSYCDWPYEYDGIKLLAHPFRAIEELSYTDQDGDEVIILDTNYRAVKTYYGAWIDFKNGFTLPSLSVDWITDLVKIKFTAGYDDQEASGSGDDPEYNLPETVMMAILFLVGHWYNNREDVVDEEKFKVPKAFDFLADQLRVYV